MIEVNEINLDEDTKKIKEGEIEDPLVISPLRMFPCEVTVTFYKAVGGKTNSEGLAIVRRGRLRGQETVPLMDKATQKAGIHGSD